MMTISASTSSQCSSIVFLMVLVSATLHLSGAFDNHVPTSICQSMTPSHGASPQTSASPYVLTASASCYIPGQALTVSLSGVGSSTTFKGLLVEARQSGSNTASYGTFSTNGDTDIQTVSCFGQANSAVSHANSNPKLVKSFLWTPPATISSSIEITATVLESYTKFWTGVKTTINVCAALGVSNVTDAAASSSSTARPSTTISLAPADGSSSSKSTSTVPSRPTSRDDSRDSGDDSSQDDSAASDDRSSERRGRWNQKTPKYNKRRPN